MLFVNIYKKKKLKKLFILDRILFIASYSSSDNDFASMNQTVLRLLNTTALLNLAGNDATALTTLNGQPAGDCTSKVLTVGEVYCDVNSL